MQRKELAQHIADALFAAEYAADRSLRDTSALILALTDARIDNRISAVVGSDAMSAASEAVQAFGLARERLVRAHHALAEAAPALVGRDVQLTGPFTGKPAEDRPKTQGLRAVA